MTLQSPHDVPIDPQLRLPALAVDPQDSSQACRGVSGRAGRAAGQHTDVRIEVRAWGTPH